MESISSWIIIFLIKFSFLYWVLFKGGAQKLQGTFRSGFLFHVLAPRWSVDGIKIFAWLTLIGSLIVFIIGLFNPQFRAVLI